MKRAPEHLRARTCQRCGAGYSIKPSSKSKYCGKACKDAAARTNPPLEPRACVQCATVFMPSKGYHAARYCSKRCVWEVTKGPEFNARIAREGAKACGDRQRDRGDGKSYRKVDGRHEHRVVAEKMVGRPLKFEDVVHHRDGNKRNNAPDNLEVMTRPVHMREHGLGIPGVTPAHKPWEHRRRSK